MDKDIEEAVGPATSGRPRRWRRASGGACAQARRGAAADAGRAGRRLARRLAVPVWQAEETPGCASADDDPKDRQLGEVHRRIGELNMARSPWAGEGYCKVWARLRVIDGIRVGRPAAEPAGTDAAVLFWSALIELTVTLYFCRARYFTGSPCGSAFPVSGKLSNVGAP